MRYMSAPLKLDTRTTTPKRGRPRAFHLSGTLTAGGGGYAFTDDNGTRVEIDAPTYRALAALARDPNLSYEQVGRDAEMTPDAKGNFSPVLSAKIRQIYGKCHPKAKAA